MTEVETFKVAMECAAELDAQLLNALVYDRDPARRKLTSVSRHFRVDVAAGNAYRLTDRDGLRLQGRRSRFSCKGSRSASLGKKPGAGRDEDEDERWPIRLRPRKPLARSRAAPR